MITGSVLLIIQRPICFLGILLHIQAINLIEVYMKLLSLKKLEDFEMLYDWCLSIYDFLVTRESWGQVFDSSYNK